MDFEKYFEYLLKLLETLKRQSILEANSIFYKSLMKLIECMNADELAKFEEKIKDILSKEDSISTQILKNKGINPSIPREDELSYYRPSELHMGENWDTIDIEDWDKPIKKKSFLKKIVGKLGLFYGIFLFNLWKIKWKITKYIKGGE